MIGIDPKCNEVWHERESPVVSEAYITLRDSNAVKDQYISLEEIATVDGTPTVIGQRSAGGNACSGSAFILSFPSNAAVKIDGPLDACNTGDTKIEEKQITVR